MSIDWPFAASTATYADIPYEVRMDLIAYRVHLWFNKLS